MSTKDYGCFFCEGKSTDENGICDICGKQINVEKELLKNKFGDYKPIGPKALGRGYFGWTLHAISTLGHDFAIKIIPKHRFSEDTAKLTKEAEAAIQCTKTPHRHIAQFFHLFETKTNIMILSQSIPVPVIVLVFDYIPKAKPLRELINSSEPLNRADVFSLLSGIASGLSRMDSCGLWHDDLHDDNILVREVQSDENLPDKYEIKIIDFGSATPKNAEEPEPPKGSDYDYFSKHIYSITAHFEKYQFEKKQIAVADRMFSRRLRLLASRIADRNISRRNITPNNIINEMRRISSEAVLEKEIDTFEKMLNTKNVSIRDPLENSNALYLLEQDIPLLFIDTLAWEQQLVKSETVIITGPRGCGKTMLLRYLAITNQARPRIGEEDKKQVIDRLKKLQHISFFVSCPDIKTPFVRSAFEKLEKSDLAKSGDFGREYINLNFAIEVARTLLWLQQEKLISIDITQLEPLSLFLAQQIKENLISSDSNLQIVLEDFQRHSINLSNILDFKQYTPTNLCKDDFLIQLATIVNDLSFAGGKQICFLLDDYSIGILPLSIQKAYNSVVFKTSLAKNAMRIKLSSEGDGPILVDQLDRPCKEGREFHKVNLGETYFSVGDRQSQGFIEAILNERCEKTKKGSLQLLKSLLGEHEQESKFGTYICTQKRPGNAKFYGFGLLCKLCSGDVSYIIELFKHIVGPDWYSKNNPISAAQQDQATKRFAREQLATLRRTPLYGTKLYQFAMNVGNHIKLRLINSENKNNPDQRIRIEISGQTQLNSEAQKFHDELLRHSVIIRGGSGKDWEGKMTQKFYFRRLFAPCFPFSPLLGECIDLSMDEYEKWLLMPDKITGPLIKPDANGTKTKDLFN